MKQNEQSVSPPSHPNNADRPDKALLGSTAAMSTVWLTLSNYGGYVVNLLIGMVLARVLSIEDFGIFALAGSMMAVLSMFGDWGVGAAVVSRKEIDETFLRTAFTVVMLLVMGIFCFVLLFALIWRDTEPVATQILLILGGLQVLASSGQFPEYLLERAMRFKTISVIKFLSGVLESLTALVLALLGFGLWSLVVGRVVGAMTSAVGLWMFSPWKPRLGLDWTTAKWLYGYTRTLFISNNLILIQNRFDDLMVGVLAGKNALGLYSKSFLLSETVGQMVAPGLSRVMLSTFSVVQDDLERMAALYEDVTWAVMRLMLAYSIPVGVLAPQLVVIVFGEKWLPIVPILRVLLVWGCLLPLQRVTWMLLIGLGMPNKLAQVGLLQTAFYMPAVMIFTLGGGPVWTAVVVDLTALFGVILYLRWANRKIRIRIWRDMWQPVLAGGTAGFLTYAAANLIWPALPAIPAVLIGGTIFVAIYLALIWLFERHRLATQLLVILDGLGLKENRLTQYLLARISL